jgi:molybdate transport system substrate-binding protein
MSRHHSATLRLLLSALLLSIAGTSSIVRAANVTVFAAASLKEALDAQAKAFEARSGDKVVVSYAASNALARQIEAGAGADIFVSADIDWMNYLDERKLIAPGTRVNLLRNTLVLVAPADSKTTLRIAPKFDLDGALGRDKLAMANPDSVPAGKYGRSALEALGVWSAVAPKVARADNVRAALVLVSRGEAPFGIVYATDALADKGVRIVDTFPADTYPPIVYPAAIVAASASPAARPLLDYLRSPSARAVWQTHGFEMAQ